MRCEARVHSACEGELGEDQVRFCTPCYSTLMPYSPSNRLRRDEYDLALENHKTGFMPPVVHDPILDTLREFMGDQDV